MWTCPSCGRSFASRNQSHTCAALGDLDRHFARSGPQVRAAFDAALACVRAVRPVQVLAEKTRIALQVRMSFAAFMPRRDWLTGHLVLARRMASALRHPDPAFRRHLPTAGTATLLPYRAPRPRAADGSVIPVGQLVPVQAGSVRGEIYLLSYVRQVSRGLLTMIARTYGADEHD